MNSHRRQRRDPRATATIAACVAILFATWSAAPLRAQSANGEEIPLQPGRSAVIKAPWAVSKVSVAEPKIADVQVVTTDQVVVLARAAGATDLVLWSEDGKSLRKVVRVELDLEDMKGSLSAMLPTADLQVVQSRDVVIVQGTLRRAEDAARLRAYMESSGTKFVDFTSLAGVQQVLIKVRVAEASRQALRSLGINAVHAGNSFFGGSLIGGNQNNINIGPPLNAAAKHGIPFEFNSATSIAKDVTVFFGVPPADLQFFIEALEDNQYIRVLAEPSLVAMSGEEASFLAGGEFPVPVVQGSVGGSDGGTSITIEFKEFGIRLRFRPTVLGDGTIRLRLAPEVSALSDVGAVQIEGFSIPSLTTRRAETTLEMRSGQTFALAGLIDQETRARAQKVPGLGDVPVLGALFRSVRYQQRDTELVVLATVELVTPMSTAGRRPVPGDLHGAPSDWELYTGGQIEGRTPEVASTAGWDALKDQKLERLRGPGAWAGYMDPSSHTGRNAKAAPAGETVSAPPAGETRADEMPADERGDAAVAPGEGDDANDMK